ncbi:DUF5067 domain-containing protein [Microbacterium sp. 8M]|uniref:DUF5067 domain-containing protein n=1 Tax=Microbacterium sp. 8M TaxID=2653153 RepID=UPI0013595EF0|nr:DUF5067 domain-containing protein [Microbacterium sp. 8M]
MLLALGAVAVILSGCSTMAPTAEPAATVPAGTGAASSASGDPGTTNGYSFEDGVLTTPEIKIVITDHKVIPVGQPGNEYGDKPVIAFWYDITNLSDKKKDPMEWIFLFAAYQDNNPDSVNELHVASLPDQAFLETQMEEIKKGGTVANAVAYALDDETTPVDLVALRNVKQTEIGRMTLTLK